MKMWRDTRFYSRTFKQGPRIQGPCSAVFATLPHDPTTPVNTPQFCAFSQHLLIMRTHLLILRHFTSGRKEIVLIPIVFLCLSCTRKQSYIEKLLTLSFQKSYFSQQCRSARKLTFHSSVDSLAERVQNIILVCSFKSR